MRNRAIFTAILTIAGCKSSSSTSTSTATATATATSTAMATATATATGTASSSPPSNPVLRDQAAVTVDGVTESWRLEWRRPPIPNCMGDEWYTCPCNGEEFGEKGDLDLVREHPGEPEDRLGLNSLFDDRDALLPRWQPTDKERKALKVPSPSELQTRPIVPILKFGDYDHDGRATEFLLQVESTPCGHQAAVVVGVDRKNPKLHVFSSVEAPKDFLTLRPSEWEKVKTKLPQEFIETACGDHGSDQQDSVAISIDAAGLHAVASHKDCRELLR